MDEYYKEINGKKCYIAKIAFNWLQEDVINEIFRGYIIFKSPKINPLIFTCNKIFYPVLKELSESNEEIYVDCCFKNNGDFYLKKIYNNKLELV